MTNARQVPCRARWNLPSGARRVALIWLIVTECAMFTIFVVAYLFYLGKSLKRPSTIGGVKNAGFHSHHLSALEQPDDSCWPRERAFERRRTRARFLRLWWAGTIALGGYFLFGTARGMETSDLSTKD